VDYFIKGFILSYYKNQESLVNLSIGLQSKGWNIYGFHADDSDSMTDYFNPARWQGVAVKNGFILVVDCYYSGGGTIGGDFIRKSYDAKVAKRILKLQTLADNHAASEGERANALAMIKKLDKNLVSEILEKGDKPAVSYMANPKGSKWHIEKDGVIIAKGIGVYGFSSLKLLGAERTIIDDFETAKWMHHGYFNFSTAEDWAEYQKTRIEDKKEVIKKLDKFFKFLDKLDAFATLKIEEGEETQLIKKMVKKETIKKEKKQVQKVTDFDAVLAGGTIEDFTHSKTGESLKVLKVDALSKEDFKSFMAYLKDNKIGYYSKFAKGFILHDDYLETLEPVTVKADVLVEAPTTFYKDELLKKIDDFLDVSLSKQFIIRAYSNISFSPEKRAITERETYKAVLLDTYDDLILLATDEAKKEQFKKMFDAFFVGYSKRFLARLEAKSRCFSVMITGSGGFNNSRHQKANDAEHKKSEDLYNYFDYMVEKIKKALTKKEKDTIESLKKELKSAEDYHNLTLKLNAIHRKKISFEDKMQLAGELTDNISILEGFKWNLENKGQFYTVNSNSRLNTLKNKIKKMEALQDKENLKTVYVGFEVVSNFELERYQILFSEIPDETVRSFLKSHGFRWSGKNKAWQVFLTDNGKRKILSFVNYMDVLKVA